MRGGGGEKELLSGKGLTRKGGAPAIFSSKVQMDERLEIAKAPKHTSGSGKRRERGKVTRN